MDISNFDFNLPKSLIASRPLKPRSSAKLLFYEKSSIKDLMFFNLPEILNKNDLLVFNNTKVLPALEMDKRVHYVNKSLNNWNFDKWQHIDFASSDFREQTKNQMENKTQCISQLESVI